jgi:hypothetical protein
MTSPARLLALTLLLPSLALAQSAPAVPGPAPAAPAAASAAPLDEATWSFGAGLSYGSVGMVSLPMVRSYYYGAWSPSVFAPTASIEWRLAPRTWLAFGLTGGVSSQSYDPLPPGSYGPIDGDAKALAVSVGVRQVAWSRPLFEVSVLGLAELGATSSRSKLQQPTGAVTELNGSAWLVGASAGLAVDRELTPGLSLRLATELLRAAWQSGKMTEVGVATSSGHDLQVSAVLVPRIELRLAF